MKKILIIILLSTSIVNAGKLFTDSLAIPSQTEINYNRLTLVFGGYAGIITLAHLQNYNSWWKGERSAFHFGEDGAYALGADKLGHFYFTYLTTDIMGNSFVWSGVEKTKAFWYGASLSLVIQLYVEVEDGFTKKLGFSVGDAFGDFAGAFYPVLQNKISWLRDVRFKWSFIPSEKYKQGMFRTIIDDYESMYFWLCLSEEAMPKFLQRIFPSFLGIAIGYGVKNLYGAMDGERELYVGLDYNFSGLLKGSSFLVTLGHALDYIHFPSPTIRITPSMITYGLQF